MEKIGLEGVFETANFAKGLQTYNNGLTQATGKTNTASGAIGSGLSSALLSTLGSVMSAAGGIALLTSEIHKSIVAASEAETGMMRLDATLKATGRGSEISSGQIDQIAISLMKVSTFDDDAIVNAYNAISKFESVPTGNMEQIVKTAMDMAAAMGGDLADNAESIGRLLESGLIPRTWGFSTALKAQIKAQIEAGDTAGALNVTLAALEKRYGGQDAAQLTTYAGRWKQLANNWGNVQESVGAKLLPALKNVADGLNLLLTGTLNVSTQQELLAARTEKLGDSFRNETTDVSVTSSQLDSYTRNLLNTAAVTDTTTVAMVDMGAQYNALSGYAQTYDKYLVEQAALQGELAVATGDSIGVITGKLADLEAAQKRQTDTWVLNLITQTLSVGGLDSREMQFLLDYQVRNGLISKAAAQRAQAEYDAAMRIVAGFDAIAASMVDKSVTYTTNINTVYTSSGSGPFGGGGGGGKCCFAAGTLITLANGTKMPIENIRAGDAILSHNGLERCVSIVSEIHTPIRDHICIVTFENGVTLKVTNDHPLYTAQGWKSIDGMAQAYGLVLAGKLETGDSVLHVSGEYISIQSIEYIAGDIQTYHLLNVEQEHNYYANGFLAHNIQFCAGGGYLSPGETAVVGDWPGMQTGFEELIRALPGGGVQIYPNSQLSSVQGGSAGAVTVTVYADVANNMDVEALAYRVADVVKRRGR